MCYSATASFTASTFLFATGLYSVFKACRFAPNYLMLAIVPLIFALQQALEGSVWLQMHSSVLGMAYLFFAYFFWPGYIPFSLYAIEPKLNKKRHLKFLGLIGAFIGAFLYLPILFKWVHLEIYPLAHSLCYDLQFPKTILYTLALAYLIVIVAATWISSIEKIKIFGFLLTMTYLMSYLFFKYAFTSVWCFLGALLSLFLTYMIPYSSKN